MHPRKVNLIIFDLDGTLIDSKKDIISSVNFALKKVGFKEIDDKKIESFIGTGVEDLIEKSLGKNKKFFEKTLKEFKNYFNEHSLDNSRLYNGVKDILEYFKNKNKAIITNRRHEFAVKDMKGLGIDSCFDFVMGGDDIKCLKPDACQLNKAIKHFDAAKNETIIVGDMDLDVQAGKSAQISTCAVTYGIGKLKDIERSNPDFIINSILELKKILE